MRVSRKAVWIGVLAVVALTVGLWPVVAPSVIKVCAPDQTMHCVIGICWCW